MKRARKAQFKPRNPLVVKALQRQAGAHRRKDKRAERARLRGQLDRQLQQEQGD
jgi:hypothetical protein